MATIGPERRTKPRAEDPQLRGRRSEPRAYVVLPALTQALSGHRSVKLLDVSQTGARIEADDLPPVGRDIVLKCAGIDTIGKVTWAASGRCGVHFYEPIPIRELVAIRDLAQSFEGSDMTAEEREAAADWANGLAR
jgi:hypothetical protein